MTAFVKVQVKSSTELVDHWIDFEKVAYVQIKRYLSGEVMEVKFGFEGGRTESLQQGLGAEEAIKAFENYVPSRQA